MKAAEQVSSSDVSTGMDIRAVSGAHLEGRALSGEQQQQHEGLSAAPGWESAQLPAPHAARARFPSGWEV